jgi:hypothetical protein
MVARPTLALACSAKLLPAWRCENHAQVADAFGRRDHGGRRRLQFLWQPLRIDLWIFLRRKLLRWKLLRSIVVRLADLVETAVALSSRLLHAGCDWLLHSGSECLLRFVWRRLDGRNHGRRHAGRRNDDAQPDDAQPVVRLPITRTRCLLRRNAARQNAARYRCY